MWRVRWIMRQKHIETSSRLRKYKRVQERFVVANIGSSKLWSILLPFLILQSISLGMRFVAPLCNKGEFKTENFLSHLGRKHLRHQPRVSVEQPCCVCCTLTPAAVIVALSSMEGIGGVQRLLKVVTTVKAAVITCSSRKGASSRFQLKVLIPSCSAR